jgi:hypothetical protein
MSHNHEDLIKKYNNKLDAVKADAFNHPKDFPPGLQFDIDTQQLIGANMSSTVPLENDAEHRANIERCTGHKVPDNLIVRLAAMTLQQGADNTPQRWWYKYKFIEKPTTELITGFDAAKLLRELRSNRKRPTPTYDGEASLNIAWNDWQTGKAQGGGTPALIERFHHCIADMVQRAKELKKLNRGVGVLNIYGIGDLVEGCFVYPNQSWELDLDRRAQVNVVVALLLSGLDELAPYFTKVRCLVVPGNHGEHRIDGKKINYSDNDDLLVWEMAARAAERDPRLQHVSFSIAFSEQAKTMDVNGWIVGITHGNMFRNGATSEVKAKAYLSAMQFGAQPVGSADLFVSAHFHHRASKDWGKTMWQQPAALDGGSQQYTDVSGQYSMPSMLSWVMTPESRYTDEFLSEPPIQPLAIAA